mgnify:CR=1 FL=1
MQLSRDLLVPNALQEGKECCSLYEETLMAIMFMPMLTLVSPFLEKKKGLEHYPSHHIRLCSIRLMLEIVA